jgi:hypothetical protein
VWRNGQSVISRRRIFFGGLLLVLLSAGSVDKIAQG